MDDERDVYLQLRDIQTSHMFLPGKIPSLAGKAADEIERLRADRAEVYAWIREPDVVENADLEWITNWLNRRPLRAALAGKEG